MKTLIFRRPTDMVSHPDDVDKIVGRLRGLGYLISREDAHASWKKNSEAMATQWLELPASDMLLLEDISRHCDEA